jgi:hypothetical protein
VRSRQQNCFGREFFGVPLTGVTRFQKAVAQVPVGLRSRLRITDTATDPVDRQASPALATLQVID